VKFGLNLPCMGSFGDVETLVGLATEAEAAGWDGVFIWDHLLREAGVPFVDPWIAMTAMAVATERVRIGPMVTPVPRRRPEKMARETATLDHVSNGRLILGVGSGGDGWGEMSAFGEETDPRRLGDMLDEGLAVIDGLWSGESFSFEGEHSIVREAQFLPSPVQRPRIPVWVAGRWPNMRPFRRAAQWDGVFPIGRDRNLLPDDVVAIRGYIDQHRTSTAPFDIVARGPVITFEDDAAVDVAAFRDAGATWWIDTFRVNVPLERVRGHIAQGPPV
jgi:alkanesulfonate monooxygenase SsuD/methylene tetrahydromethanopterin reductase-like flavin-dependent oxidoreductase (luciferase family)